MPPQLPAEWTNDRLTDCASQGLKDVPNDPGSQRRLELLAGFLENEI